MSDRLQSAIEWASTLAVVVLARLALEVVTLTWE